MNTTGETSIEGIKKDWDVCPNQAKINWYTHLINWNKLNLESSRKTTKHNWNTVIRCNCMNIIYGKGDNERYQIRTAIFSLLPHISPQSSSKIKFSHHVFSYESKIRTFKALFTVIQHQMCIFYNNVCGSDGFLASWNLSYT